MLIFSGDAHPQLARALAGELGAELAPAQVGSFADGETSVRLEAPVRGEVVCLVQPTGPPVNHHLLSLALMIDAAKAAGAARVLAVAPYFGYSRQDRRSQIGEPRSARFAAHLLASAGLDDLITLDLHAPALESAFAMPVTNVRSEGAFWPRLHARGLENLVVVSPDAGGLKRAQRYAAELGAGLAALAKHRPGRDTAQMAPVLGEVRGRTCLLVDDLVSTGGTLVAAAHELRRAGAREVLALFTHAVMADDAWQRLLAAPIDGFLTSDALPIAPRPRLEIVPVAPLLAAALQSMLG